VACEILSSDSALVFSSFFPLPGTSKGKAVNEGEGEALNEGENILFHDFPEGIPDSE